MPEKQLTRTRKGEVRREVMPILNDTPILIDTNPKPGPVTQSQDVTITQTQFPCVPTGPENRQTPSYIYPITSQPPRPQDLSDNRRDSRLPSTTNPNIDFGENSLHQEGIISEMYVSPDQSYIEEPQE